MKKLIFAALLLSGCTTLDYAKTVSDRVCAMPEHERSALRGAADVATYPNRIRVECAQ